VRRARTILVIEDERVVARDIQRALIELGYDVPATAATAQQALDIAAEHHPQVAVVDIRIRGPHDGITAAKMLRERHETAIVFLSAYTDSATMLRAREIGACGYLSKPVRATDLRRAIECAFGESTDEEAPCSKKA